MRAAVICPTSLLEWLQEEFHPTFHMALAQVCIEDPEYAKFFKRRRFLGDTILLDQGAAELGAAIEDQDFIEVVKQLQPQLVVAPDVIHDSLETIRRTEAFLLKYGSLLDKCGAQIVAVPQGDSSDECLSTFKLFNEMSGVHWLGVSKFHYLKFGSRYTCLVRIGQLGVRKPCHLLGVHGSLYDLVWEKEFPFVQSTDTAKPVKLGLQDLGLGEESKRSKSSNFFKAPYPPSFIRETIKRNVEDYLSLTGDWERGAENGEEV